MDQHDDTVGETEVGVGGGSVCISFVCINMVQRGISLCWFGDMLIETRQSVHQVYVVEILHNHIKSLLVLALEQADVVVKLL